MKFKLPYMKNGRTDTGYLVCDSKGKFVAHFELESDAEMFCRLPGLIWLLQELEYSSEDELNITPYTTQCIAAFKWLEELK